MAETELKPCPFCGGLMPKLRTVGIGELWQVRCATCSCCSMSCLSASAAAKSWNRRPPPSTAGWLPISTAPKDGTDILVRWTKRRLWAVVCWVQDPDGWLDANNGDFYGQPEGRWRHLPKWPPTPSQEGASEERVRPLKTAGLSKSSLTA